MKGSWSSIQDVHLSPSPWLCIIHMFPYFHIFISWRIHLLLRPRSTTLAVFRSESSISMCAPVLFNSSGWGSVWLGKLKFGSNDIWSRSTHIWWWRKKQESCNFKNSHWISYSWETHSPYYILLDSKNKNEALCLGSGVTFLWPWLCLLGKSSLFIFLCPIAIRLEKTFLVTVS